MNQFNLGVFAQQEYPFLVKENGRGSNALMGLIFVFSFLAFAASFIWLVVDLALPLIQLPVLLLTLLLVVASGFLYFLNPARFLAFFLIGLVYFSFEATIRAGGGGALQSGVKGVFTVALAMLGLFTGMRYVTRGALPLVFVVYAVFATVSAAYSPAPFFGAVAGVALLGVTIIAAKVGAGSERDVSDYWRAMYWASVLTAVFSFLLLAISPMEARDLADMTRYRFKGITGTANSLGPLMAGAVILALYMIKRTPAGRWRYVHWGMLAVFGLALVLTNSRSSIMGLVAAMAISWFFTARIGAIGMLIAACVLSLFGVVIFYPGLQDAFLSLLASLFARSGHVAELTTFTGRQQIWEASWRLIQMAPWIGYGMSSVAIVLPRAHSDEWGNTVATAHNSLLESLISVGWLGTLPLILVVILAGGRLGAFLLSERRQGAGMEANQDLALCGLRFLVMMLVQGFSEKAFAGHPGSPFLALGGVVATAIYIRGVVVQRKSTSLEAS